MNPVAPAHPRTDADAPRSARPLRVLVVTVVHDPEDARIRHRELRALLDAGAEVTYAAPFRAYGRDVPAGTTGIDLPRAHGKGRAAALRAATTLLRTLPAGYDVVLVHDPELLVPLALAQRALRGATVVWDVHEDTAAALRMKTWLPAAARLTLPLAIHASERWAERHMHLLLAEDSYAGRFARQHPVVPNSVLVPAAAPSRPGPGRVVYVGRLTAPRGALDMLEVARALRVEMGDQMCLEIVGNADADVVGALTAAAAAGEIVWHGFMPNAQALAHLDGALAGLSLLHDEPNYAHSRPTKVMEYMAYGVPVVTTPNPASARLVERHRCGIVVPFEDPKSAAAALIELHLDNRERERLAQAGREAACRYFDWHRDGRAFVATLEQWVREVRAG